MKQATYHFIIEQYCPREVLFDGVLSFPDAHRLMDEKATPLRRVGYKVFNEYTLKWEDFKDSYHGSRMVYDHNGELYVLDPDYRHMWLPEKQRFHLWFMPKKGTALFVMSFSTEPMAQKFADTLSAPWKEGVYVVKPSDFKENI